MVIIHIYKYRLESAKEALESSKLLMNANSYKAANNRAYYAIFHAINAVHALNGVAYKRHKDALANFNKENVSYRNKDYDQRKISVCALIR